MNNFNFHLSTEIHFGKGILSELTDTILRYGTNVFFMYDEIPAKATGTYDQIHAMCDEKGIHITDFTGIEPNPRHTTVDQAVELCKESGAECIIALGGGSTIDSAKTLSFSVFHDGSCWDFFERKVMVEKALPIITIPTIAASGSEVGWQWRRYGGVLLLRCRWLDAVQYVDTGWVHCKCGWSMDGIRKCHDKKQPAVGCASGKCRRKYDTCDNLCSRKTI